jgi:NAD(P)-dependent dehydrogenase (short-subunit alcohol dehydrogenase family)
LPDATERVVLVTGASRGIGRAAATALASAGSHVIAVARTVGGLEELDDEIRKAGGAATLVPLDLKDGVAIDRLGAALYERFGRVDALFANAGVLGPVTPVAHIDPRAWDTAIAVNLTANQRLIRSLDPLLKRSTAGRALFVTSGITRGPQAYLGLYAASKAGLEALVATYAAETMQTALRVNLINPGPLRTRMRAEARPGEDAMTLPPPQVVAGDIVRMLSPDFNESGVLFDFPTGVSRRLIGGAVAVFP